ncbi:SdpI family protein [Paenibacillus spiritus]|uniref:SdpI family protein n=1 Tax=Paenibacillus spiritus TaxID=2496557 RepID=A0A5J5G0I5_9BACL|nr:MULTISPECIES: SdpI family protein [Paenibacillus]KAA8999806.1 SdpI family protein [Paenibacillus spiritus]
MWSLTFGLFLLAVGWILKRFPPRSINSIYGFRTSLSMSTETRWREANRYCAVLFMICGAVLLGIGMILNLFLRTEISVILLAILMLASFIVIIARVERRIKKIE